MWHDVTRDYALPLLTSVNTQRRPQQRFDGLEDLPALLRFRGAGKAHTTLPFDCISFYLTVETSARTERQRSYAASDRDLNSD